MSATYSHVFAGIAVLEATGAELTPNGELVVRNLSLKVDIHQQRVEVLGVDWRLLDHDRELQGAELRGRWGGHWLGMLLISKVSTSQC